MGYLPKLTIYAMHVNASHSTQKTSSLSKIRFVTPVFAGRGWEQDVPFSSLKARGL